ncbi:MAG TPA: UDP-N-acetylmuramyl-tripeptide synthetase, partial [Candidatus Dormibacteraeota bacterium]|nr:UDP-N-acetylmuramyl-tripeptide synthetase [Candidatus Dormibacteraeota bacterium]
MNAVKLTQLLEGVRVVEAPPADPNVSGIAYDSRRLKAGDCFVAIPGTHTDGHRYVETALRDGAVAAVVQRRVGTAWPQIVVEDTRRALALMSSAFFGHPSRAMTVIGVTGTDGKTTTTTMIHQMLQSAGRSTGSMSTVDIRVGDRVDLNTSRQTTLEALEIQEQLAQMRDAGIQTAVIETSSHGLALQRVLGIDYDIAVFTNIAHEHLDFHKTIEAYREAKASLIDLTANSAPKGIIKTAVLNRDDPSYAYLSNRPIDRRITYGVQLDADLKASRVEATADGLSVEA